MDVEVSVEAREKRLTNLVALTVVVFSVFMAICKVKDDNIVQAMQLAKADAVDLWNEYQAARIKLHFVESEQHQQLLFTEAGLLKGGTDDQADSRRLAAEAEHYRAEGKKLAERARGKEAEYDRLNYHDDQFDLCDAALSVSVACAAVAALTSNWLPLICAWLLGTFGMLSGIAAFAGWAIHPNWLVALLS